MTKHEEFPDGVREAARDLRFRGDDPARWTRLRANIMRRVTERPETVAELLSRWFRVAVAPLAAAAILAVTAAVIVEQTEEDYGTATALVAMHSEALTVDE